MIISEDITGGQYRIKSYTPGEIIINETKYHKSLVIAESQLILDWRPQQLNELQLMDLDHILVLTPSVILIGTGPHFIMPPASLVKTLQKQGIAIEYMDTSAACRTFMALISEGRRVVAALFL